MRTSDFNPLAEAVFFKKEFPDIPYIQYQPHDQFTKFFGVSYASLADIYYTLSYHCNGWFLFIEHDKDILSVIDDVIEYKPRHVHILFYDGGKHTVPAVRKWFSGLLDPTNGQEASTLFTPAGSMRGCARYLIHLDNPEKTHYQMSDVTCSSTTAANRLYDYCSASGNSYDRQLQILSEYCRGEIPFTEACRRAPELFMKNSANVKFLVERMCYDLGIQDRLWLETQAMYEELRYNDGNNFNDKDKVSEQKK